MRKTQFKILSIVIFTVFFAFIGCNNDDFHYHEYDAKAGIKSSKITSQEFKKHTKAFNLVAIVNNELSESNPTLNRIVKGTINNFTVDTKEGLYLQYANLHSFTFPIHREKDNGKLENLVLSYQNNGIYNVKILQYDLTPQEKVDLKLDHLKTIKNPIITIPIENFKKNLKVFGCETITETIWVSCGHGVHNSTNVNSWPSCTSDTPPRVYTVSKIKCIDAGDSTLGGGPIDGGGGSGGFNYNNYPPEYPTSQTDPEDYEQGISAPVEPSLSGDIPELSPCNKVKKITNNTPNLKDKITDFKTPQVLNLNHEKGFNFVDNSQNQTQLIQNDGNANTSSITVIVPEDGSMSGLLHSHFERPDMLPTFTFEDLMTFNSIFQWRKYKQKSQDKLTLLVVTRAGVFAMMIENETTFDTNGYNLWTEQNQSLKREFYKNIVNKENLTDEDVIIEITKSLSNYGIGLYQANSDLSNWNRLSVDENNTKISTPCN